MCLCIKLVGVWGFASPKNQKVGAFVVQGTYEFQTVTQCSKPALASPPAFSVLFSSSWQLNGSKSRIISFPRNPPSSLTTFHSNASLACPFPLHFYPRVVLPPIHDQPTQCCFYFNINSVNYTLLVFFFAIPNTRFCRAKHRRSGEAHRCNALQPSIYPTRHKYNQRPRSRRQIGVDNY